MESTFKEQLLQSQMEVQEATLSTLSKDLHDNIGQLLSTTKMLIGITERELATPSDTLHTANETLGKAITELRSLSKSMNKEWLEQFDVKENLLAEANRINFTNTVKLHLTLPEKIWMKADEQVILFRILQEGIQNAIKHADASNISVKLDYQNEHLVITVNDNGKGFEIKEVNKGLGINNIEQRTKILGGTAAWLNDGHGCTLLINIPVKEY